MATEIRHEDTTMEKCNLLIIGRSGNGLKSVMNSILQSPNNMFQRIDCTSIGDPDEGVTEGQYLDEKRKYYSQKCKQLKNVNAIVFVMKYGDVEDTEDKVNDRRRVHSDEQNKLPESCIDQEGPSGQKSEEQLSKDRQDAFMTWCRSQTGDIDKLFQEVKYRCVLFDNKTKDGTRSRSQVEWFNLVKNETLDRIGTLKIQKITGSNNMFRHWKLFDCLGGKK
ncbi:hypothetical protein Btru_048131 [Bulinus truncatus]|nr:hypothetical protein Btru_048131 [Bulinus truncatus]